MSIVHWAGSILTTVFVGIASIGQTVFVIPKPVSPSVPVVIENPIVENPINANNLISKINQRRSDEKLAPLTTNSKLSAAAEKKLNSYADTKKWEMPSGELDNLLRDSGYSNNNAGFAMTRDFNDLDSVVRGILNDETTKDTILTKTGKDIGAAVRVIYPYKHLVGVVITAAPEIQPVAVQPTPKQQVPVGNQIDCTGPDGKHLWITQKACDDFNAAWGKTKEQPIYPRYRQPTQSQYQYQAPQTFSCVVSYPCTGSVNTYQLTTADCINMQDLARTVCTPVQLPQMPKYEEYKPNYPTVSTSDFNQDWPTIGPSIPQFPQKCEEVGNSTVVICK